MLKATLRDNLGNSLHGGDLGGLIDFIEDFGSGLANLPGAIAGVPGAVAANALKVCDLANDPRVQTGAAVGAAIPTGVTQGAATTVAATSAGCAVLNPSPSPLPPLQQLPTMASSTIFRKIEFKPRPVAPAIPAGSIAAFDPKRGAFRIAVPAGLSGFSAAPAAFTEIGTKSDPGGALLVDLKTFEKETGTAKPWYKRPLVLGGIGLGVVALGAGGYALSRG